MSMDEASTAALWWAVVGSGVYHGLNPGMGWPLAVSAALMERRRSALVAALAALAVGHLLAMMVVLLPFSLLAGLIAWERPIRLSAAAMVTGFGLYLLVSRRHHPRYLARVAPHRLVLWSFLAATAHGAGLMLLPIYLSLTGRELDGGSATARTDGMAPMDGEESMSGGMDHSGHDALAALADSASSALLVAGVHTCAMLLAGAALAVGAYAFLGLRAVSRTWFNLDTVWAITLVAVGLLSGAAAF